MGRCPAEKLEKSTYCAERPYDLVVALLAPKEGLGVSDFYAEVKEYLRSIAVEYVDLGEEMDKVSGAREKFYWYFDAHFSPEGNEFVADVLTRKWGADLRWTSASVIGPGRVCWRDRPAVSVSRPPSCGH